MNPSPSLFRSRHGPAAAVLRPATELAAAAGIDERNAAELLKGLTVAGYLTCEGDTFAATDMTTLTFGPDFMIGARGILGGLSVAVPGLTDRLAKGGRVADVAGGNGDAAIIGAAFPARRVTAYDRNPSPTGGLPSNVELVTADASEVVTHGDFDLITCLDSLHRMNAPEQVVAQLRSALAPGGVLLVAEGGLSGDVATDAANP